MKPNPPLSRRGFLRGCAATAALSGAAGLPAWSEPRASALPADTTLSLPLDDNWRCARASAASTLDAAPLVRLPHTVVPLSWQNWDPDSWQDLWLYRRDLAIPAAWRDRRLFLHFERVMAAATPAINKHSLVPHRGGFLPFDREITDLVAGPQNLLEVAVDARWLPIPPAGSPRGPAAVDYLLPGGLTGSVSLRAYPAIFLREVFAKPVDVLTASRRRVEILCRTDAAASLPADITLTAVLHDGPQPIASASRSQRLDRPDQETSLTLANLPAIQLWSNDTPHLYSLEVTLSQRGQPLHRATTRIGFREARFADDGFYLNGRRTRIFGLNRHELYPYLGFAAPRRLLRRDAEILRHDFNCNMVRCSHYPQSEAFLDACDELGLLVWEELPGWQYIGDDAWQQLALEDLEAMIRRDRNHPSIVVWGDRINESRNDPALYAKTRALAHSLDDSRQASGTMTPSSRRDWQTEWHQDLFAFDDYHADPAGTVGIDPPLPGVPYLISEAVGQFNYLTGKRFDLMYRRGAPAHAQAMQAVFHAEAHDKAAAFPRCAGVIAWCAFDYASLMNAWQTVKYPGIADSFRLPKLGASFYQSQRDPALRPVIAPSFYWDFSPAASPGPGPHAAIFSNCERLELFLDDRPWATLHPDRAAFPHLDYPPFFADFSTLPSAAHPELRIDGYLRNARVLSRRLSSDRSRDRLWLAADHTELDSSGSDATRLAFAAADAYGNLRAFVDGSVTLHIEGPGSLIGDNPFDLSSSGGAGAVWIQAAPRPGAIRITATHPTLGTRSTLIRVTAPR